MKSAASHGTISKPRRWPKQDLFEHDLKTSLSDHRLNLEMSIAGRSSSSGVAIAILDLILIASLITTIKMSKYPVINQLINKRIHMTIMLVLLTKCSADATKCHICMFHLAHCTNPLDCYNQPDTCSNTNFSPLNSQVVDCEFGCEQYVITDATGSIVLWRRGCATDSSPKSSYICFSRNIFFMRHEQCWCHTDRCNSGSRIKANQFLLYILLSLLFVTSYYARRW